MSNAANRGKSAEQKVREHLKALAAANANFDFQRNQDAHAAGGRMSVPQVGDFAAFGRYSVPGLLVPDHYSRNFIIEVKEVKHGFRLPYQNYSADKVARVSKRVLAGAEAIVLVRFMPADEWRAVPQEVFAKRNPEKPSGSWDLSAYPFVDYRTALNEFMGVTP